jgi:RNA polymerase sigma-70 factor (ECF subfamily)
MRAPSSDTLSGLTALPASDLYLIRQLESGKVSALEELYERYSGGVLAVALHLLADRGAAEEIVQETFLKLWRKPGSYEPTRGKLLPWLLGVAHHHSVDLLRRRQLERRHSAVLTPSADNPEPLESLSLVSAEGDPSASAGIAEQRRLIVEALAGLPAIQRIPIELAYYSGLTQAEIAAHLNEPLGTIKTRMRLGLLKLRAAPGLADIWNER